MNSVERSLLCAGWYSSCENGCWSSSTDGFRLRSQLVLSQKQPEKGASYLQEIDNLGVKPTRWAAPNLREVTCDRKISHENQRFTFPLKMTDDSHPKPHGYLRWGSHLSRTSSQNAAGAQVFSS